MTLRTYDKLEQRTSEWYEARRGIVTASTVGQLITTRRLSAIDFDCPACDVPAQTPCKGKRTTELKAPHPERAAEARKSNTVIIEAANNETSRDLTHLLVSERITKRVEDNCPTFAMERGICDEPIARAKYSECYAPVREVGFMVEDKWGTRLGFSPDGLVGDDGLIEVKSRTPKNQVKAVLSGVVPAEHMPQLQCGLLISGRKWIDYVSYRDGMALWVKRVFPDPKWFDAIIKAVRMFEANAQEQQRVYEEDTAGLPMTEQIIHEYTPDVELEL